MKIQSRSYTLPKLPKAKGIFLSGIHSLIPHTLYHCHALHLCCPLREEIDKLVRYVRKFCDCLVEPYERRKKRAIQQYNVMEGAFTAIPCEIPISREILSKVWFESLRLMTSSRSLSDIIPPKYLYHTLVGCYIIA